MTIVIKGRPKSTVLHKAVASRVDRLLGSINLVCFFEERSFSYRFSENTAIIGYTFESVDSSLRMNEREFAILKRARNNSDSILSSKDALGREYSN